MINCGLGWGIKFNALVNFLERNLLKTNFLISLSPHNCSQTWWKKIQQDVMLNLFMIYNNAIGNPVFLKKERCVQCPTVVEHKYYLQRKWFVPLTKKVKQWWIQKKQSCFLKRKLTMNQSLHKVSDCYPSLFPIVVNGIHRKSYSVSHWYKIQGSLTKDID